MAKEMGYIRKGQTIGVGRRKNRINCQSHPKCQSQSDSLSTKLDFVAILCVNNIIKLQKKFKAQLLSCTFNTSYEII